MPRGRSDGIRSTDANALFSGRNRAFATTEATDAAGWAAGIRSTVTKALFSGENGAFATTEAPTAAEAAGQATRHPFN
ncbi:hypothetical protein [Mycetocola zhujimingii]|uniref:hypothetical protein n=1 Tax=Mycetocola zhujimingii TaxID=2079792 RepID=UPI000D38147A|nr:hypothetical protein [Mycetocola zhujimingii]AWB87729.1 hypothetical protein C3E77_14725 [Mycetocola zhujimingii]